jgi:hypothetical protein
MKPARTPAVSDTTLIQTSKGIRQIRSLFPTLKAEGIKYTPPEQTALHFGKTTHPVSYLSYSGVKPTTQIKTSSGKVLIGSYNHPVLTLNPETKRIEYIPLAQITLNHHLIGVVANTPITETPPSPYEFNHLPYPAHMSYDEFLSGSYAKQMGYVAFLVMEGSLSLRLPSLLYAQAVAAVAALMGCYSSIKRVPPSLYCGRERFLISLVPLVKDSILSQLVGPSLCSYVLPLARNCRGAAQKISEYFRSCDPPLSLRQFKRSHLYADQVVSVELADTIPLYSMSVPRTQAFIGNGYIQRGFVAPAAN